MNALDTYLKIQQEELETIYKNIDQDTLVEVANLIKTSEEKGNRVHITGIGKPGHLGSYIASLFSSIGTPCYFLDGTEAIHGSSGQVREGDVVIAISNSGNTEELVKTLKTLKNNKAHLVAVVGNKDSWMGENCEYVLLAGVSQEGDSLNKPPRTSILAEAIVLQALSVLLQEQNNLTPGQYVKWHPGGALGQSVTK